jgi:hypothetical protein
MDCLTPNADVVKEAKDAKMVLHDDDPTLFEVLLEFAHTRKCGRSKVEKLATYDGHAEVDLP